MNVTSEVQALVQDQPFEVEHASFDNTNEHQVMLSLVWDKCGIDPVLDLDMLWSIANVPGFASWLTANASKLHQTLSAHVR